MYIQQILDLKNLDFWAFFITNRSGLMKENVYYAQVPSPLSTKCGIEIWTTL